MRRQSIQRLVVLTFAPPCASYARCSSALTTRCRVVITASVPAAAASTFNPEQELLPLLREEQPSRTLQSLPRQRPSTQAEAASTCSARSALTPRSLRFRLSKELE